MFYQEGGGANYLCMPKVPEYTLRYRSGEDVCVTKVWGSEYEVPIQGTNQHDVPCAVCYVSSRPSVLMIPAKTSCPPNWIREYYGYIMTEWKGDHNYNHGRTMFECVDKDQESLPGSHGETGGVQFYHVEADYNTGLPVHLITLRRNSTVWCVLNNYTHLPLFNFCENNYNHYVMFTVSFILRPNKNILQ